MDSTIRDNQNEQPQQRRDAGGIISRRTIDSVNSLARMNPFGKKVGLRIIRQTATKGIFSFLGATAGVWVPIVATLFLVIGFTIIILLGTGGFTGAPPTKADPQAISPNPTANINPTITPTETPTPSPAAP